jgi:UPF0755 protein
MRLVKGLLLLLVLLVAAGGVAAFHAYDLASEPFKGYSDEEIFFTVEPGQPSSSIARALQADGIVRDQRLFIAALRLKKALNRLQAGEYLFSEPESTFDVIDRLAAGDIYYLSVTIPEGLTITETAALLSEKGLGDADAFGTAFEDGKLVASLDPEAVTLEGYLFPETYRFPRNPAPDDVARAMVDRFVQVFDEARRAQAATLELDVREVVTLASIVEKETGLAEERPLISSVFWNRLKRRMALQSDPTIIYDLKRQGRYDGNLRREDLKWESPYNTYLSPGLPPGPIASPGQAAIDAVLFPADTSYLYFVSKNDGSHHFSSTLREHSNAVRKYQIEYFRQQRRNRKKKAGSS